MRLATTRRSPASICFRLHYLGAAGVDLFFVISGFVMVQSADRIFGADRAAAIFLARRWFRIAPLYWIVMTAYALLQIAQGKWNVIDGPRIVASALFFPMQAADCSMAPFYGIGWTLNYEMFFYAIFAVWLGLRRGLAVPAIAATIAIAVVVGQTFPLIEPLHYWFNAIILDFQFGVLIAMAYERGWTISLRVALLSIVIAIAAVIGGGALGFNAVLPEVPTVFPRWIAWGCPAAIIMVAVTLCQSNAFERPSTIGRSLGDASYSIYLLHPIVIILLRKAIPATALSAETTVLLPYLLGFAHIAVVILVTALVSIANFIVLERPMIRLGKSLAPILQRESRSDSQAATLEATRLKPDV